FKRPDLMIIALHGFTGRGSDFAPLEKRIKDDWFCPDLPGHGPKPSSDCSPEATSQFVGRLHTQHKAHNLGPNILLGYSMGARAALFHTLENRKAWDALVLISSNPGIEDPEAQQVRIKNDEILARKIEEDGVKDFLNYWIETPLIKSQKDLRLEFRQRMQKARAEHTAIGLATSLRQFGQGSCPNLWPRIKELELPVLLITGGLDSKYTQISKQLLHEINSEDRLLAQHVVIEGASHMPHLENLEESAAAIDDFLLTFS
ncbi:MAG: alpha/beta fold hydrolase, partial [Verrucomicrobiota bacterium]